jgi:SAM-dependent methyltransferase
MTRRVPISEVIERLGRRLVDWRYGVRTETFVGAESAGLRPGGIAYPPPDWFSLHRAIRRVPLKRGDVFLDYGCGLVRALITAARYPCTRVVGLGFSDLLARRAKQNLLVAGRHLRFKDSEVIPGGARHFAPPIDITVASFYNRFGPDVLAQALERLRESLAKAPRPLRLLVRNPHHFEELASMPQWLTKKAEYADLGEHRYVLCHAVHC